jgi:hypothetical protein
MSVINRRNAVVGYLVVAATKSALRHKAKEAVPSIDRDSKRPNKSAIAALLLAGTVGVATFWHKRNGDDSPEPV